MIRSCEDIETLDDFRKFAKYREDAFEMGLKETASIMCWNKFAVMNPNLFDTLFEKNLRKYDLKND